MVLFPSPFNQILISVLLILRSNDWLINTWSLSFARSRGRERKGDVWKEGIVYEVRKLCGGMISGRERKVQREEMNFVISEGETVKWITRGARKEKWYGWDSNIEAGLRGVSEERKKKGFQQVKNLVYNYTSKETKHITVRKSPKGGRKSLQDSF